MPNTSLLNFKKSRPLCHCIAIATNASFLLVKYRLDSSHAVLAMTAALINMKHLLIKFLFSWHVRAHQLYKNLGLGVYYIEWALKKDCNEEKCHLLMSVHLLLFRRIEKSVTSCRTRKSLVCNTFYAVHGFHYYSARSYTLPLILHSVRTIINCTYV